MIYVMRVVVWAILILSLLLQPLLGMPDIRCAFNMGMQAVSTPSHDMPETCCCCEGPDKLGMSQCPMPLEQMASCMGIDRNTNSPATKVDQHEQVFVKLLTAHLVPHLISSASTQDISFFRPDPQRVTGLLPLSRPSLCVWLT